MNSLVVRLIIVSSMAALSLAALSLSMVVPVPSVGAQPSAEVGDCEHPTSQWSCQNACGNQAACEACCKLLPGGVCPNTGICLLASFRIGGNEEAPVLSPEQVRQPRSSAAQHVAIEGGLAALALAGLAGVVYLNRRWLR
jgi:hypothetical protein